MTDLQKRELRRLLQSTLILLGYDLGPTGADGRMGPYTRDALRKAGDGSWPGPRAPRAGETDMFGVLAMLGIMLASGAGRPRACGCCRCAAHDSK